MQGQKKILLVGAGLAGSLMAIYLAKRGYEVHAFESRPDMRRVKIGAGRSINLALSHRGIRALQAVGVLDGVLKESVAMRGRMMHALDGALAFMPYSYHDEEYINSISRGDLNKILLSAAEQLSNVHLYFEEECIGADFDNNTLTTRHTSGKITTWSGDVMLGTDGANSAIRHALQTANPDFVGATQWEQHGYKELTILPTEAGGFKMERNALHIWARGTFMLIALPNYDGTFTCTLFLPLEGDVSFAQLQTPDAITAFFQTYFADTLPLFDNLTEQFLQNPIGKLGTLRCAPWHWAGKAALMGDAAHAVVPFYGQGMNASFEDCIALNACLDTFGDDWAQALPAYYEQRKKNSDAIAALALENFIEMRDKAADKVFMRKRKLELAIEQQFKDYHSKYSLVTFHPEIPYQRAQALGNAQDALLMELCAQHEDIAGLDMQAIYTRLVALR